MKPGAVIMLHEKSTPESRAIMARLAARIGHGGSVELAVVADKPLPIELRIFPSGDFETEQGPFTFDRSAAELVAADVRARAVDIPFDYGHSLTNRGIFSPPSEPSTAYAAAGWCKPEVRGGELWATGIRWTPKAEAALRAGEYRYLSPTFEIQWDDGADDGWGAPMRVLEADGTDKGRRRVCALRCVALENIPAMHGMDPIMAAALHHAGTGRPTEGERMDKRILVALGLAETATIDDVVRAITLQAANDKRLLELTGKASIAEAVGVVEGWKSAAARLETVSTELATVRKTQADAAIEKTITDAKAAGKITPANEPKVRELAAKHGAEALAAFLDVTLAHPAAPGSKPPPVPPVDGSDPAAAVTLTAAEEADCKRRGLKPELFLEAKKKLAAAGGIGGRGLVQ